MCDIGFCVAKIIRGTEQDKTPCFEACNFNQRVDKAIEELEKTEIKTEGIMFDGTIVRGKRKRV